MAKALFGHVGVAGIAADPRAAALQREVAVLRAQVADLRDALDRECRARAELTHRLELLDTLSLDERHLLELDREPALT